MRVSEGLYHHRRFILLLLGIGIMGGVLAIRTLPVALFPAVHFPRVVVDLDAGDQPAERMAVAITTPLESELRTIPGIDSIRSVTSRGSAEISVRFAWGSDMDLALTRTQGMVSQSLPDLPAGTRFTVRRMDPTVFPVVACSLVSGSQSPIALRRLAWFLMRPELSRVPGVAKVSVLGGEVEELHVLCDPGLARAHGVTIEQITDAVSGANVDSAVGRVQSEGKLYLAMTDTQARTASELEAVVIRSGNDGEVHLGDVARVVVGSEPQWTRVVAEGKDAVSLEIYQQPDGNTVAISQAINQRLALLRSRLPVDVHLAVWYDQSELIIASANGVRDAVAIGIVLAAIVLLVFLRSWRITVVAVVCVPAVLVTTVLVLQALHMSFNIMTLGGMAAAVGLIIDDAIVMVEYMLSRMRVTGNAEGMSAVREAIGFIGPMAGSSLATIIIFLPLAFLSGIFGSFFTALSLTMTISLVLSFLVAMGVVPIVTALLMRPQDVQHQAPSRIGSGVLRTYQRILSWLLRRPYLVVFAIVPLAWGGWIAFSTLGTGFMPAMDEGGFTLDYRAAPGTSLAETDRLTRRIGAILGHVREVATYSRRTGLQLGGGITEANEGDIFVRLIAEPRRPIEAIMADIRAQVAREVPALAIDMSQLMEDMIGDLVGNPHPVEIILAGDDSAALAATATTVADQAAKVSGVVDVNSGVVVAGDALEIEVNRSLAAHEGLDPTAVSNQVRDALDGTVVSSVQHGQELCAIRVWTPITARQDIPTIAALTLHGADGHPLPLSRLATITRVTGQAQIDHQDLRRVISVTAQLSDRDLGSTIADLQHLLDHPGTLPPGITYQLGGIYAQQQDAFHEMVLVLVSAVALVFLLLVFLYANLRLALAIVTTTVLSVAGVVMGLRLTGMELNITAMMGLTMVVGIVTEVSILFASSFMADPGSHPARERLVLAGQARMRPITMTIIAAVLALMPLAIGLGHGADMQRPLAIAIISGLALQLPLALVVLPMLIACLRVR